MRYLGQKSMYMHINGHRLTSMRMPAFCSSKFMDSPCFLLDVAGMTSSYFHWMTSGECLR